MNANSLKEVGSKGVDSFAPRICGGGRFVSNVHPWLYKYERILDSSKAGWKVLEIDMIDKRFMRRDEERTPYAPPTTCNSIQPHSSTDLGWKKQKYGTMVES